MKFQDATDAKLKIQVDNHPEHVYLTLEGEVDLLGESLLDLVANDVPYKRNIIVDLRKTVFFLPSIGRKFLIKLAKKTRRDNELKVIVPQDGPVKRAFTVMTFHRYIPEDINIHYEPNSNN
ncbi:MAG: hypothetical protein M1429_03330 [Patescibacteria group bacterium]|nr:hypothetical protein [Patescibacteria group bacterium]